MPIINLSTISNESLKEKEKIGKIVEKVDPKDKKGAIVFKPELNFSSCAVDLSKSPIFDCDVKINGNFSTTLYKKNGLFGWVWITDTQSTTEIFKFDNEEETTAVQKKGILEMEKGIKIKDSKGSILACVKALIPEKYCMDCGNKMRPLCIAFIFYQMYDNMLHYVGSCAFPFKQMYNNVKKIRNLSLELFMTPNESNQLSQINIGELMILENNVKFCDQCKAGQEDVIIDVSEIDSEFEKIELIDLFLIKEQNFDIHCKNANRPMIADSFFVMERSIYYLGLSDKIVVTEAWIKELLYFSFALSKVESKSLIEFYEKCENGSPDIDVWNKWMSVIIRAFTMFVNRYDYSPDILVLNDDKGGQRFLEYEHFSGPLVVASGTYDCEDGSWMLMAIMQSIQKYEGKDPLIQVVRDMANNYVVVNGLVESKAPQIARDFDIQNGTATMHMTCLMIPKSGFYKQMYNQIWLNRKLLEKDKNKNIDFKNKSLHTLILESTVLLNPDPVCKSKLTKAELEKLNGQVEDGNMVMALPIHSNTCYECEPFDHIITMYTDHFVPFINKTRDCCTVFYCSASENSADKCSIDNLINGDYNFKCGVFFDYEVAKAELHKYETVPRFIEDVNESKTESEIQKYVNAKISHEWDLYCCREKNCQKADRTNSIWPDLHFHKFI